MSHLATGVALVHQAFLTDAADEGGVSGWLLHFRGVTACVVIGLVVFAEAGALVGFFIPGETAAVIGGVLAGLGRINLEVIMAVVVVCAIAGDSVGFELGKRFGPWLLERPPLAGRTGVRQAMGLLERYGGPAVFMGRFLAFARAFIPGLAGMSGMRYRVFLLFNALGGIVWGVGYTLLGFIVGLSFQHVLSTVGLWSLVVVGAVVVVLVVVHLTRRRRVRSRSGGAADDEPAPPDL